jgi:hypothetical protein
MAENCITHIPSYSKVHATTPFGCTPFFTMFYWKMYSIKAFHIGGQFIEISGPCGMKKRFAKGTKASFAVERFNCLLKDPTMPVVCIAAVKEGEEPIEFGNDVELILYDNAWTLQIVQEGVFSF